MNSVYKVLAQTVPDTAKTDAVREMELYLGTMIRQVDSSLLDEWEKMRDPNYRPSAPATPPTQPGAEADDQDITRDSRAFTALVRNRIFSFLRSLATRDFDSALAAVAAPEDSAGHAWTKERLEEALNAYEAAHERISLDPEARNLRHTHIFPSGDQTTWRLEQVLVDPEQQNDWVAEFIVDLPASRETGEPVLRLQRLASLLSN